MKITLPENLSTRLSQLATKRQQSVETILSERLFTALDDELDHLPTDEQSELRALHYLSDDALRFIAAEQMTPENQTLITQLMVRNSEGAISQSEEATLVALVERGDRLMLRKAETAAILANRGHAGEPREPMTPHA